MVTNDENERLRIAWGNDIEDFIKNFAEKYKALFNKDGVFSCRLFPSLPPMKFFPYEVHFEIRRKE